MWIKKEEYDELKKELKKTKERLYELINEKKENKYKDIPNKPKEYTCKICNKISFKPMKQFKDGKFCIDDLVIEQYFCYICDKCLKK